MIFFFELETNDTIFSVATLVPHSVRPTPLYLRTSVNLPAPTLTDLPYTYGTNGKLKREPNLDRAQGADTFGDRPFLDDIDSLTEAFADGMRGIGDESRRRKYAMRIKTSPADVVSFPHDLRKSLGDRRVDP